MLGTSRRAGVIMFINDYYDLINNFTRYASEHVIFTRQEARF